MVDEQDRKGDAEGWGERPEHREEEQHVPYAQQANEKGEKSKERPDKDEHASAGQGLSG